MVEIRVLSPEDWRLWRRLRLAALAEAPYAFGSRLEDWQGDGDQEARWRGRLSVAGSHNVLALLDGEPVGMVSGVPTAKADVVELISMWVAPEARGLGVADDLLDEVERWAGSAGARVLRLDVTENNAHAAALYQRHGFQVTGELGELMPDGVRRERVMEKRLARRRCCGTGTRRP